MNRLIFIFCVVSVLGALVYWLWPASSVRYLPQTLQQSNDLLYEGKYDSAMYYAREVVNSAKNQNNLAYAEAILGYCWYVKDNIDSSYYHYKRSLRASNKADSTDYYLKVSTLNQLGIVFQKYQIHKKAIEYFGRALKILEVYERPAIAIIYYNMAYNQRQINDIECVKSYYNALQYATKHKSPRYESLSLNALGNLMLETSNYESAIEYYKMALSTDFTNSSKKYTSFAFQGLGEANFHLDQIEESEKHLNEGLAIILQLEDKKYVFRSYQFLGRLYEKKGDSEQAEKYYLQAIEYFSLADHTRENIGIFRELSKVQQQLDKIEESSLNNMKHYQELEKYLDEKEKAAQLARQDLFEQTVAISESNFRKNMEWLTLKDEVNWHFLFFISTLCISYFTLKDDDFISGMRAYIFKKRLIKA
jgi:tetratricopeptide (TPR) repeat protein